MKSNGKSPNQIDKVGSKHEIMKKLYEDIENNAKEFLKQINENTTMLYESEKVKKSNIFDDNQIKIQEVYKYVQKILLIILILIHNLNLSSHIDKISLYLTPLYNNVLIFTHLALKPLKNRASQNLQTHQM